MSLIEPAGESATRPGRRSSGLARCAAFALAGLACACAPEPENTCGPASAKVTEVVDGDTIVLETGEKVRYLMVDSPESTTSKDCYGEEAKDFNRSLVLNQTVTLRYDKECTDRYKRLLAYVSVNGREVNTLLVERGFACVLHIAPNGDDRVIEFNNLMAAAKTAGKGLWSACNPLPPACQ
jgi:micrococcal nuclease